MVKIRLRRFGKKNTPVYRVVVADGRSPRDGRIIEEIGTYDPLLKNNNFTLNLDRVDYWLGVGAKPSNRVARFLGDLGMIDDDGFVFVQDRAKDMVLRAGENVYCAEVEAAIYEHPAVYEAAVFGVPHERLGEEVAAAILLKDGASLGAESLRAHLAERIAAFKIPSQVEFRLEQLPRGATGKILKRELRDEFIAKS